MSFLSRLITRLCSPSAAPPIPRLVADIALNRENNFWCPYIGGAVLVLTTDPDGLVNVALHDQPGIVIPGIDPKRFT